jgi:hypothetical protein
MTPHVNHLRACCRQGGHANCNSLITIARLFVLLWLMSSTNYWLLPFGLHTYAICSAAVNPLALLVWCDSHHPRVDTLGMGYTVMEQAPQTATSPL